MKSGHGIVLLDPKTIDDKGKLSLTLDTTEEGVVGVPPLTAEVILKEVHHGDLRWGYRTFDGTLLLFRFYFRRNGSGHDYRQASITLEFYDDGNKPAEYPSVVKAAPSGEELSEIQDCNPADFNARVITHVLLGDKKYSGSDNEINWSLTETEEKGKERGIPEFLQAAVLLRRTTGVPPKARLKITAKVDWKSGAQGLLDVESKEEIINLTPQMPETTRRTYRRYSKFGVEKVLPGNASANYAITGIQRADLLAMEKLPISKYYRIK
ncbi:hypothetical protein GGR51DRAFT_569358 [Nemania sp. FL0031]|nr:hypothetical protein GGR51DRAFT_569358 [Nemania sp. FL0031]